MNIENLFPYGESVETQKGLNPDTGRINTIKKVRHGWTWEEVDRDGTFRYRTDSEGVGLWIWADNGSEWIQIQTPRHYWLSQSRYRAMQQIKAHYRKVYGHD